MLRCDRTPRIGAECDDEVHSAGGYLGPPEPPKGCDRLLRRHVRAQVELEEVMGVSSLGEDPERGSTNRGIGAIMTEPGARPGRPRTRRDRAGSVSVAVVWKAEQAVGVAASERRADEPICIVA